MNQRSPLAIPLLSLEGLGMFSIKSVIRYMALPGCTCLLLFSILGCGGESSSDNGVGPDGGAGACNICDIAIQSSANLTINAGYTSQFSAQAHGMNGATISGVAFTWHSSNTSVATVDSTGLVTGLTDGTTKITASAGGVTSDAATVTVTGTPGIVITNAVVYSGAMLHGSSALAIDSAGQ